MIPFKLIGGKWDGREGEGRWVEAPHVVWVVDDPKRENGGKVYKRQKPGAVPYAHAGRDYGFHIYISSYLSDEGWYTLSEQVQEPMAA